MSVSYDLLKQLKPSHFIDAERVVIKVPVHIVERHKAQGIKPIFEIDLTSIPSKVEILEKIDTFIEMLISRIPGLHYHHFNFRMEGSFSDRGYV